MSREIRVKQGASLLLQFTFQNDDGTPVDLTNLTLASQVRDPEGVLVATLPIVLTGTEGVATVTVADTSQWAPGTLRGDVAGVTGGLTVISETFGVRVERAVTQQ